MRRRPSTCSRSRPAPSATSTARTASSSRRRCSTRARRFRMADELLEAYLRQLIEAHARVPEVQIAWQGGEPTLMGLDFFRRSVELAERYLQPGPARRLHDPDQRHAARRGVGGVLRRARLPGRDLDRRPAGAARRLPGEQGRQGLLRPGDARARHLRDGGRRVERADDDPRRERRPRPRGLPLPAGRVWRPLRPVHPDHRAGRARPTRTAACPGAPGATGRSTSQEGSRVTGRSVTAEQYGRFLIDVFEEWVRRDVGEVYVQMFDVALANWVGEPPGLCIHSETCGLALALEHTGDLYSCDHFVEPKHKLGNIQMTHMLELVASPQQRQFGLDKRETLPQYCLDCDVRFACHGGCPKDRFIETPDGRARPQLPLRRLQGLLPPRRPRHALHGRAAAARRRSVRDRRSSTPPRTPDAAATTRAPAAAARSGSAATVRTRRLREALRLPAVTG